MLLPDPFPMKPQSQQQKHQPRLKQPRQFNEIIIERLAVIGVDPGEPAEVIVYEHRLQRLDSG
ncbi:hypothetical protein SDC9_153669 [bioreactor metagenome]|uniref:Uncharacterized protein n=1 Tax=bioreactor metagenome TaxID=1076179 RepID=A0A645F179_9ZZZZ